MAGHQFLVDLVQSVFTSVPLQLFATVVTLVTLSAIGVAVRAVGQPLKDRLDDALVESIQAGFLAVLTAALGGFLITVWRAGDLLEKGVQQIDPSSTTIISVVLSIATLAAAYSVTRVTKTAIRRLSQQRGAITNHQQVLGHHIAQIIVFTLAILMVFGIWGVNPSDLLLGAGVATVVLGLAARQTLGAVLAGFVVLFSRPFELGDWVQIGDAEGIVTDISIVNTQLRTFDEEYVMIPNDIVTDSQVVNRSRKGRLRLETDVGVDYTTDIEQAMEIAADAMAATETPMERPDPHVVLNEFGPSSVVLRLRYFIDNPSARKMWKARTEVISAVKAAFAEADIKIPFPQRELTGREEAGGFAVSEVSPDDVEADDRVDREDTETGVAADGDTDEHESDTAQSKADGDEDDQEDDNEKHRHVNGEDNGDVSDE